MIYQFRLSTCLCVLIAIFAWACKKSEHAAVASPAVVQTKAIPAKTAQPAVKAAVAQKTSVTTPANVKTSTTNQVSPKPTAGAKLNVVPPKTQIVLPAQATQKAPAKFAVRLETTKGNIDIDFDREWAPVGADRFYNLVQLGYYSDVAFFRVIPGFMAQVGLSGMPKANSAWRTARITDDPVKQSNTRGMVTFATSGPNSRTTQFFINFKNNARLDGMGFAPVGKVRDASLAVLDGLHSGYGEGAPRGRGPNQGRIQREGNTYLRADFPSLDYIKKASILKL